MPNSSRGAPMRWAPRFAPWSVADGPAGSSPSTRDYPPVVASVLRYRVREGTDAGKLLAAFSARVHLEREPTKTIRRVVYETFDWRFLAAESVLEHRRSDDGAVLVW